MNNTTWHNTIKVHYKKASNHSPLRYPGGKACLSDYLISLVVNSGHKDTVYVEPYCGGGGAALSLLFSESVASIVLNDLDNAIYAFWKSATEDTDGFIELIRETEVTIDEWYKQKELYEKSNMDDLLRLGFAAFFLNRTNRSGILSAGPIGGKEQTGKWKIDARFNKELLMQKIRRIGNYQSRITAMHKDGLALVSSLIDNDECFFYIDPPYYLKSSGLYLNAFTDDDHRSLAKVLNTSPKSFWLLSYDNNPFITNLYSKRYMATFNLNYSASNKVSSGSELMVFSDALAASMVA